MRIRYDQRGRPQDRVSTGNRDDLCYAQFFSTKKSETLKKKNEYLKRYPTFGYSTQVSSAKWIIARDAKDYYYIHLTRWHSCD